MARVTFRIPDNILDDLNNHAAKNGVKLSEQVRLFVVNGMNTALSDKEIERKHLSDNRYDVPESKNKWDIEAMIERQKLKEKPKVVGHLGSKRVE